MKRLLCVLACAMAFMPGLAAGAQTFKAGAQNFAVFSLRFVDADTVLFTAGDYLDITVLGVRSIAPASDVFTQSTPTASFSVVSVADDTIRITATRHEIMGPGDNIWVKVALDNPQPALTNVLYFAFQMAAGSPGGPFAGTATNNTLAFVDFDVAPAGPAGPAGQSVVTASEPPGANCPAGGVKFVSVSGTEYVCNGAAGAPGAAGAQGPAGPAGADGAQGPAGPPGAAGGSQFPTGGILLLVPGAPAPSGFTFIGSFSGFGAWKKN